MNTRNLLVSVLMLVSVLFSACAPAAAATPPSPTAVPPTTAPPTVAPTIAAAQGPTAFSSKVYKLPMSVSFGPDWHVVDEYTDLVTVAHRQKDWSIGFNIVTNAKVADPVSGNQIAFPADFVSWLTSNPDFTLIGEPSEVMLAGHGPLQIDATPISAQQKDFLYLSGTRWNMVPSHEQWRFILFNNIDGERLLIMLIVPASQFKDAIGQVQSILDSVTFTQ